MPRTELIKKMYFTIFGNMTMIKEVYDHGHIKRDSCCYFVMKFFVFLTTGINLKTSLVTICFQYIHNYFEFESIILNT